MNRFRNLPFKFRIFFGCLAVAMIPLFFSTVLTVRVFNTSFRRQSLQEGQNQLSDINSRLDQLFQTCEQSCISLSDSGAAFRSLLDKQIVDAQKDAYLSLYHAVQETFGYVQFSVYDAGGKLRYTTDNALSRNPSLPLYWGLLRSVPRDPALVYSRADSHITSSPDILLQGAYPLENASGTRTGYLVLDFTRDGFDRLLSGYYSANDTLILLDQYQVPFYNSQPELSEAQLQQIILDAAKGGGSRYQYLWCREPGSGYYILLQKDAPVSSGAIQTMQTVSLLMAVLSLGICLLISLLLSRSLSQPISALDHAMRKVQGGDLSVRVHTNRRDELGRLTESFNHMARELKENLELQVQKQNDLNETRLRLYQTQLNPHFLYNTLDTIKWNARIHQNPDIPVLAENLAAILRKSISSQPFITLHDELETIRCYIEIQKIRFSGRFLYETEVPDQLETCMVPKMILQPLVENAILHGLGGCENGYICIYALLKDPHTLTLAVTDDGCGMSPDMVAWLNSSDPPKRDGHLGLYNVIQILKLYYGQEYGLKAEVIPGEGTTITITLPTERS